MRMSTTYVSCNSNSLVLSSRLRENTARRREERERSREEGGENAPGRREERERSREEGGERMQQGGGREIGQQYLYQ